MNRQGSYRQGDMTFTATLELGGKTATGIVVPAEVVEALGAGRKPPVVVTIGTHSYRSSIAARGGRFMLPVSADNREKAGIKAGDEVEVDVVLDTAPRVVEVPEALAAALAGNAAAKQFFESLSYSHQLAYVLPINDAKKPETRDARVEKTIAMLSEGKKR